MAGKKGRSGRPVTYTEPVAEKILHRLMNGETLKGICRDEYMPPDSTVRLWALDDREGFAARYARAREIGYHVMADDLVEIADTPVIGEKRKTDEQGNEEVTTGDMIEHRRLQVDTRKWMLARALPKIYGDKLNVDANVRSTILVRDRFDDEAET